MSLSPDSAPYSYDLRVSASVLQACLLLQTLTLGQPSYFTIVSYYPIEFLDLLLPRELWAVGAYELSK